MLNVRKMVIALNKFFDKVLDDKRYFFVFILILTVISVLPIFMLELPYGGDLNFHLKRIEAIKNNFEFGLVNYPIYFKYLNNYGYASGLFYPDLFLNIPAFLNYIGIDLFLSYRIFLFLIKFFSLISIYYSVSSINKSKFSGLLSLVLYAFSSYIFIDMFERGALAETITVVFIPLVIRGIYEIIYGDVSKYYFFVIGILGVLYSHIISFYIISIFLLFFIVINIKKITLEKVKVLVKSVVIFLLLSSHFLFPLFEQMLDGKFYYNGLIDTDILLNNSVPVFFTFLEVPYYMFLNIFTDKWIPCGIGIIYFILIIYYLRNKTKFDNIGKQFLFLGLLCILFASKTFIWRIDFFTKIFSYIQFPFRIYILATILFIIAFTRTFSFIKDRSIFLSKLTVFMFLMFVLNLFYPFINIKVDKLTDDEVLYGEYLPIEYPQIDYYDIRENKIMSNCNVKYDIVSSYKTYIDYTSQCDNLELELPLIYYKGYSLSINNEKIPIYKSQNGLIKINTTVQNGHIEIFYDGTIIYKVTKYVSIITFILIIIKYLRGVLYVKK